MGVRRLMDMEYVAQDRSNTPAGVVASLRYGSPWIERDDLSCSSARMNVDQDRVVTGRPVLASRC